MTAATTLCGLQGVGRRRYYRFNQEGREAKGGLRSRTTRIRGVEKARLNFPPEALHLGLPRRASSWGKGRKDSFGSYALSECIFQRKKWRLR